MDKTILIHILIKEIEIWCYSKRTLWKHSYRSLEMPEKHIKINIISIFAKWKWKRLMRPKRKSGERSSESLIFMRKSVIAQKQDKVVWNVHYEKNQWPKLGFNLIPWKPYQNPTILTAKIIMTFACSFLTWMLMVRGGASQIIKCHKIKVHYYVSVEMHPQWWQHTNMHRLFQRTMQCNAR